MDALLGDLVDVGGGGIYSVVEKRGVSEGVCVCFGLAQASEPNGEVRYNRAEQLCPPSDRDLQKAVNDASGGSSKQEPPNSSGAGPSAT